MGTTETPAISPLQYPFVTHSLYIRGFLGLNMIVPYKLLIDSRLSAFLFCVSNKTAPKVMKKAPICTGAGQNKNY